MGIDLGTIDVPHGSAVIDVRGNGDFDVALFLRGQPVALNWCDCQGSVGQYLVWSGRTDFASDLAAVRDALSGEDAEHVLALSDLQPVLDLFAPGRYQLFYTDAAQGIDYLEYGQARAPSDHWCDYYPHFRSLVLIQAVSALNLERVEHFAERIRAGKRPVVLTATAPGAWCEFVIDGHHKLRAYRNTKVPPRIVSIVRLDPPELPANTFDTHFGATHQLASEYRNHKSGW
jgi:hypothetical protein